jgi:hypothetical protein
MIERRDTEVREFWYRYSTVKNRSYVRSVEKRLALSPGEKFGNGRLDELFDRAAAPSLACANADLPTL